MRGAPLVLLAACALAHAGPASAPRGLSWSSVLAPVLTGWDAGTTGDPHNHVAALGRLAQLDFAGPLAEVNATRLQPLVEAFPALFPHREFTAEDFARLPEARRKALLADAARIAVARVNGYVERTLEALYADKVPDRRLASTYDALERVSLLEDEYLMPPVRERLSRELPLLREVRDQYLRDMRGRLRQGVEDGIRAMDQGAFAEVQPVFDEEVPPRDILGAPEEAAPNEDLEWRERGMLSRFLAERDLDSARTARYPLSGSEMRFDWRLAEASEKDDPYSFWTAARNSYAHIEHVLDFEVFPAIRKTGRLGPWARALLPTLRRQVEILRDRLREHYGDHDVDLGWRRGALYGQYADREKGIDTIEGGYAALTKRIDDFADEMRRREGSARSDAAWRSKQLLYYMDENWAEPRFGLQHLFKLADYYGRMVKGARKDGDPAHLEEVQDMARAGMYTGHASFVLNVESLRSAAAQALRAGAAAALTAWGVFWAAAAAAPLVLALVYGAPAEAQAWALALAAAGLLLSWTVFLRRAWRLRGLGRELTALFADPAAR